MAAAPLTWRTALAGAETIDRIVASVGRTAITASDVEQEYHLDLFLAGKPPMGATPDSAALEQARNQFIDRTLLEEEVQANGINIPADGQSVHQQLEEIRGRFATSDFQQGLRDLGMTEADLESRLAQQAEVLRLIDLRLRPEATVEQSEIETYYRDTLLPELAKQGQQPPAIAQVEDRIREILVQQKINSLLEAWLRRLRAAREVKLYGSALVEGKP